MKKVIWLVLGLVLAFVLYDFVTGLNQEAEVRNQAGLQVQEQLMEEDVDLTDEEREALLEAGNSDAIDKAQVSDADYGLRAGNRAYDFQLEDMDGNTVRFSDFRGRPVFLNFWASWCPSCRATLPNMQGFHEDNEDVVVIGVNVVSSESSPDNVLAYVEELGLTFLNLKGVDEMTSLYRIESLPTSYFIGSDGTVYERVVGPVTQDILEARFDLIN
ncbi:TlpA family protein disulfide reductase [Alkalibacterium sp. AK22]|uniref:TlpA family protein disulfide reductase n=1 Tax=Alkalibacterium sp. AK22 TaxID=1229520 RepID=UPI0018CC1B44|nr:TlpA disulfide reductase family protein [Alkalibacterium sp. AK22]